MADLAGRELVADEQLASDDDTCADPPPTVERRFCLSPPSVLGKHGRIRRGDVARPVDRGVSFAATSSRVHLTGRPRRHVIVEMPVGATDTE